MFCFHQWWPTHRKHSLCHPNLHKRLQVQSFIAKIYISIAPFVKTFILSLLWRLGFFFNFDQVPPQLHGLFTIRKNIIESLQPQCIRSANAKSTAHREYTVIHFGMEQNRYGLEANSLYKGKIKINLPSHFHSTPSWFHYNLGIFFS